MQKHEKALIYFIYTMMYNKADSHLVSCHEYPVIECTYLYTTDTYSSFCNEITTVLPDKNNQRPVLKITL